MARLSHLLTQLESLKAQRSASFVFDAEKILAEIYQLGDPTCIKPLIGHLRDEETALEVMWSIVHLVEAFPPETYLKELLDSMPQFSSQAPDWAETLHARVINSITHTLSYMKVLAKSTPDQRKAIAAIISKLTNEDAEFERKAKPLTRLLGSFDSSTQPQNGKLI